MKTKEDRTVALFLVILALAFMALGVWLALTTAAGAAGPPIRWVRKPAAECRYAAMGGTCYGRAQPYRTYAEYWGDNVR